MLDFVELADKDLALPDSDEEEYYGTGAALAIARAAGGAQKNPPAAGKLGAQKVREPINRKMRVLVLHGRQSNENLVGFQMNQLKNTLGKEVEIKYLEGDLVWTYKEGYDNHDADPMARSLAKGKDFKIWFTDSTDDTRDRVHFFKLQDPGVKHTYHGAEAAVKKFLGHIEEEGPFDVVVGIFEGSIVVHMAVAELVKRGDPIPFRLGVFFGSMPIRDDSLVEPLLQQKVPLPTVHIFGKSDEYYFYHRTAAGRRAPEDYYQGSIVLEHLDGHQLPASMPRAKEIYERVVAEMQYQCGLQKLAPKKVLTPPKPTSRIIKNLEDMSLRKIRVLCLCGGHSVSEVVKFQSTPLKVALGKDAAEWTYIEGTKDWTWYEGEPTVSEMEEKIAKGKQMKNWYMDWCHEANGKKTDRLNKDKQFDPETWVEYKEVEAVVEKLKSYIYKEGPFDVLVGFSQGCIMMHLLMGFLRKEAPGGMDKFKERWQHDRNSNESMPWRLSVFFNGMHIRDKRYFDLFERPLPGHPTVHVFGKDDEYYDYARDGFGNKPQEEYYENPLVLTHEESHQFPTAQPRAKQIYDRVITEIWKQCGGKLEL